MFEVDDIIVYGNHGVCKIVGTQNMEIGNEVRPYFVLKPVFENTSTFYLPVGDEKMEAKMRHVLSAEETRALIESIPEEETIWIENDFARREQYKQILQGNDRNGLLRLIKTLYLRQQELKEKGRKLHASDERFLKDAEEALLCELAYALEMKPEEVLSVILSKLE